MTNIAGHDMTSAELAALDELTAYLTRHGGDSSQSATCSPVGDGRWVPLNEVWGRSNAATAKRRTIERLHAAGVLSACEIAFSGMCAKRSSKLRALLEPPASPKEPRDGQ